MAKGQSLQDPFLNALRRERVPVSIYLVNGIKLQGQIESFDQFVILLKTQLARWFISTQFLPLFRLVRFLIIAIIRELAAAATTTVAIRRLHRRLRTAMTLNKPHRSLSQSEGVNDRLSLMLSVLIGPIRLRGFTFV